MHYARSTTFDFPKPQQTQSQTAGLLKASPKTHFKPDASFSEAKRGIQLTAHESTMHPLGTTTNHELVPRAIDRSVGPLLALADERA